MSAVDASEVIARARQRALDDAFIAAQAVGVKIDAARKLPTFAARYEAIDRIWCEASLLQRAAMREVMMVKLAEERVT